MTPITIDGVDHQATIDQCLIDVIHRVGAKISRACDYTLLVLSRRVKHAWQRSTGNCMSPRDHLSQQ